MSRKIGLLRSIYRFVDLGSIRAHLADFYSHTGRPSVDPELLIRMLLVGYCFGIRSERRLCEDVHLNLAYRWFCRLDLSDRVPDHSTFYQSGETDIVGGVTKAGELDMRTALYQAATVVIHRSKKHTWLRAWAERVVRRRGAKRAAVALVRRMGVILHRMCVDNTAFEAATLA